MGQTKGRKILFPIQNECKCIKYIFSGGSKKFGRPWQDSNLQSPVSETDALSIRPQGRCYQAPNLSFRQLPEISTLGHRATLIMNTIWVFVAFQDFNIGHRVCGLCMLNSFCSWKEWLHLLDEITCFCCFRDKADLYKCLHLTWALSEQAQFDEYCCQSSSHVLPASNVPTYSLILLLFEIIHQIGIHWTKFFLQLGQLPCSPVCTASGDSVKPSQLQCQFQQGRGRNRHGSVQ